MKVLQLATGLIITAGVTAVWHYWHLNGFLAALIAFISFILILDALYIE